MTDTSTPSLWSWSALSQIGRIAIDTWTRENIPRIGAALAFYTLFSLSPLLVLITVVVGFFLQTEQAAQRELLVQVQSLTSAEVAEAVAGLIENASRPGTGLFATIVGVVTLFLGATGVFNELQNALDELWNDTSAKPAGIVAMIKQRALAFGFVLGTGLVLFLLVIITPLLRTSLDYFGNLPGGNLLWEVLNGIVLLGISTLLFAAMYKWLPNTAVAWRNVWLGAAVAALLFGLARIGVNLYLSNSSTTSVYGAAGSLVALLLWIYVSALIFLFGAALTQAVSVYRGATPTEANQREPVSTPHSA
jgi:membrane protein